MHENDDGRPKPHPATPPLLGQEPLFQRDPTNSPGRPLTPPREDDKPADTREEQSP